VPAQVAEVIEPNSRTDCPCLLPDPQDTAFRLADEVCCPSCRFDRCKMGCSGVELGYRTGSVAPIQVRADEAKIGDESAVLTADSSQLALIKDRTCICCLRHQKRPLLRVKAKTRRVPSLRQHVG
jgi:hypothetical protein